MRGVAIAAILFALPLIGLHAYARLYFEPLQQADDDCKNKSYPGSRADAGTPRDLHQNLTR